MFGTSSSSLLDRSLGYAPLLQDDADYAAGPTRQNTYPAFDCAKKVIVVTASVLYCAVMISINVLGDIKFPFCDHPVRCFDFETEFLSSIDASVDPCVDFYDHVCGRWTTSLHVVPDQFWLLQSRSFLTLLDALEKPQKRDSESAVSKVALGFQKCVAVFTEREEHKEVLEDLFRKYNFEWPSLTLADQFDLLDFLIGLSLDEDIHVIFDLSLAPYVRTDDRYSLAFTGAPSGSSRLLERMEAVSIAECVSVFSHSKPSRAISMKILQVHSEVRQISSFTPKDEVPFYIKFRELGSITPNIKSSAWVETINRHLPRRAQITEDDDVLVTSTVPLTSLSSLLILYKRRMTDLMLYLGFRIVMSLSHTFSFAQMSCIYKQSKFIGIIKGGAKCLASMNALAPFPLAQLLFDEILQPATVDYGVVLSNNIREATRHALESSPWMDDDTRSRAIERISTIIDVVGLPSQFSNRSSMDAHHAFLPSFERPFLVDYLESNRRKLDTLKDLLRPGVGHPPVHRENIELPMIIVNAFYLPMFHIMVIPGAILQAPFGSHDLPDAVNYGSIGRVVGHEILHSLDVKDGDVTRTGFRVALYSNGSRASLDDKLQCMKEQLNTAAKSKTLGNNSISQVFADNGGIEMAYSAFQALRKDTPAMGYTPNQLFFASGCFSYCSLLKNAVASSEQYPSATIRCNLPAMNMREFSEAFNCRSDTPMNPKRRCTLF